jgi:hypothetical protein
VQGRVKEENNMAQIIYLPAISLLTFTVIHKWVNRFECIEDVTTYPVLGNPTGQQEVLSNQEANGVIMCEF